MPVLGMLADETYTILLSKETVISGDYEYQKPVYEAIRAPARITEMYRILRNDLEESYTRIRSFR
jgi:hypothetical protein